MEALPSEFRSASKLLSSGFPRANFTPLPHPPPPTQMGSQGREPGTKHWHQAHRRRGVSEGGAECSDFSGMSHLDWNPGLAVRGNILSSSFTVVAEDISASEKGWLLCLFWEGGGRTRAHTQRVSAPQPRSCYHRPETQHLPCVGAGQDHRAPRTRPVGTGPVRKGFHLHDVRVFYVWCIPLGPPGWHPW